MDAENVETKSELLSKFWDLADANSNKRILAAEELVKKLTQNQNKQDKGICEDLTYTIQRLIRGLSSQRKAARLGFFITLCEILKRFTIVDLDKVKELISTFLEVTGSKQEQSNAVIGQALAYGALIRSGRFKTMKGEDFAQVFSSLIHLENQKAFTKTMIARLILELFDQCSEKKFKKYLWPLFKERATIGWQNCSADNLLMLLRVSESYPSVVDKDFLEKYWNSDGLLKRRNYEHISRILIESTVSHPVVHPLCDQIISSALNQPGFEDFWTEVVDDQLFGSKKDKLGFVGFELFKSTLVKLKDAKHVKALFSPNFLQTLITSASNNHLYLNCAARTLCSFLGDFVKSTSDCQFQMQIVNGLIQEPGSIMFDRQSQTKTLSAITMNLKEDSIDSLCSILKTKFLALNNEPEIMRKFCVKQLASLLSHPVVNKDDERRSDILCFLFLHSFFTITHPIDDINHCETVASAIDEEVRTNLAANFQNALGTLTKLGQGWKPQLLRHMNVLYNIVYFADQLIKSPSVECSNFDSSIITKTWTRVILTVKKLKETSADSDDDHVNESHSFQVLFLYLMIQLFISPEKTMDLIEEVEECCKRAMKKQRKKRQSIKKDPEASEPAWVDVVVDVLLSMLSQGNKLTRAIVDNVFCLICPHLTEQSLKQILDVLNANSEDEAPLVDENDDDEDDSGDDEDEAENDAVVNAENEELRSKIFEALGPAAESQSADEEENETYLDDDDMFKLDDALAQAFKSMKKPKNRKHSKEDEALMSFRLRCIDLLDIMMRVEPKLNLLLDSILPIISALKFSIKHSKYQNALSEKCIGCLNHLCNLRKFSDRTVDESELNELLCTLLKQAASVTNPQVNQVITNCCLFVMLCNRRPEANGTPATTNGESRTCWYMSHVKEALTDFFVKKNCHLQSSLFQTLLTRNRTIGWQLRETVQKYVFSNDTRLFIRTQGLNILSQIIRCGERPFDVTAAQLAENTDIQAEEWATFCQFLKTRFKQDLKNASEPELKPKHCIEILRLLSTVLDVDDKLFLSKNFEKDDKLADILLKLPVRKLEKDGRKFINKSIHILTGKPISEFRDGNRKRTMNGAGGSKKTKRQKHQN